MLSNNKLPNPCSFDNQREHIIHWQKTFPKYVLLLSLKLYLANHMVSTQPEHRFRALTSISINQIHFSPVSFSCFWTVCVPNNTPILASFNLIRQQNGAQELYYRHRFRLPLRRRRSLFLGLPRRRPCPRRALACPMCTSEGHRARGYRVGGD